jgi:hypothetical protein
LILRNPANPVPSLYGGEKILLILRNPANPVPSLYGGEKILLILRNPANPVHLLYGRKNPVDPEKSCKSCPITLRRKKSCRS